MSRNIFSNHHQGVIVIKEEIEMLFLVNADQHLERKLTDDECKAYKPGDMIGKSTIRGYGTQRCVDVSTGEIIKIPKFY